jgi:hypothetical protein
MGYAEELKKRAEEVREKYYIEIYKQIMSVMTDAIEQGKRSISISYTFFENDNALLKFIIEKCMEEGFVLKLYETRMEIRLEE